MNQRYAQLSFFCIKIKVFACLSVRKSHRMNETKRFTNVIILTGYYVQVGMSKANFHGMLAQQPNER